MGNKETLQSKCKAHLPPPPHTQATAFANIAQHWLDKYKKSNKKTNILDLSHSYPTIPAAPLPKVPKTLPKSYQKVPQSINKAHQKHSKTLPDLIPEK